MEALVPAFNQLLASLTLGGQLILGVIFLELLIRGRNNGSIEYIERHAIKLIFLISFGAVVVSLFYSNAVGFPPCTLCWWQRVFMYPICILSAIAIWKRDSKIVDYLLGLTFFGILIALDHVYLENTGISLLPCDAQSISCGERFVYEYGYITIPAMSLTGFAMIATILGIKKTSKTS